MNEASWNGTAGEVKDSTTNNNDGTRVGDATTTTSGRVDGCGTFDGNGDYVEVNDNASLDVTNLTINAWVNSTNFTPSDYPKSYNRIIISRTDSKIGYQLGLSSENKPYFAFEDLSVNNISKQNNAQPSASDTTSTDGRIPLGTAGKGDQSYVYEGAIIEDGSTFKMWYSGYDGTNICIYHATSSDGLNWTKYNNTKPSASDTTSTDGRIPIGTSGKGDSKHACYPCVIKDGSTYKMWYTGSDGSILRIYYATSSDGLNWTKYDNTIPSNSDTTSTNGRIPLAATAGRGDDAHTLRPTVIKDGSAYKMWYEGNVTASRIYYATSSDGLNWTKYDNTIPSASDTTSTNGRIPLGTSGKGDDYAVYSPCVIKDGSTYKMWYTGDASGTNDTRTYCATSPDGLNWTKYDNTLPSNSDTTSTNGRIPKGSSGGDINGACHADAIKVGSKYWIYYTGGGTAMYIFLATLETGKTSSNAVAEEYKMITGVADTTADTIKLYVNGALDTSGTSSVNDVNNSEKLRIGELVNGKTDEVWISTVTRSADWISAKYLSMTCQFTAIPTFTILGDGTDPGNSTVAPGSSNNYLDQFTFATDASTDSVTALTVTSANTSAIASMQIWNDGMTTQYFSTVSSPVGNDWNFSGGTPIPISTTTASFRVIFTAKDHSLTEGTYAVTGTVTSYTCTNSQSGADTDSATITVDNSPPGDATWGIITPGNTQIELNWTNPGDSDFNKVLILRKVDSEVTDSPTEGTEYNVNDNIGGSTVRYVGSGTNSTDTGLTNGTSYYYKIFAYDTYINYAAGVSTGPHVPVGAGGPITTTGSGYWHSTIPGEPWPGGIVPAPEDTVIIDTGHVVTSTAPVTISSITVTGSLYLDAGGQAVAFTINDGGKLINSGTVRVSSATYNVTLQAESGGGITFEGNDINYNGKKIYLARLDYKPAMSLGSGETVELSGSCTFYAITTQSGSSFIQGSNNDIYISSNTTLASGTFTKDAGSGKVYFIGDLELASANQNLGNVYIGSSPETTTLTEDFSADSLTINDGDVFNTKGYEVTVTTDIVINGTLDCTDSAPNNEGDGTIIILGRDWTKADTGTFTVAGATVTFDNSSSTSTLTGSTTFYGLVSTASGKRIEFSSSTVTYVTGYLNLEDVILRSTLDGATWYLTLSGTQDVSGVDVQDSNASGGSMIYALNSTDSGNNTNWNFNDSVLTWDGSESTDWNTAENWNFNIVPLSTHTIIIPDVTTNDPQLSSSVSISSITIESGGQLSLNNCNITISNDVSIYGSLICSNTEQIVLGGSWLTDSGATFTVASSTVTFAANGGTHQILMNGASFYNLIITTDTADATYQLGSDLYVLANFTQENGTLQQGANEIRLGSSGGESKFTGGTFTGGSADILVISPFTISGSSFTATSSTMAISSDFTFSTATFNANNGLFKCIGSGNINVNADGITFYDWEIAMTGSAIVTHTGTAINVANDMTLTSGLLNRASGDIMLTGDLTCDAAFGDNTANNDGRIKLVGSGDHTVQGTGGSPSGIIPGFRPNKTGGTIYLGSDITVGQGSFEFGGSGYTLDAGSHKVTLNMVSWIATNVDLTLYDLEINSPGLDILWGGSKGLTVTNTLALTASKVFEFFQGTPYLAAQGSIVVGANFGNGTIDHHHSMPITLSGSAAQVITYNAGAVLSTLIINKTNPTDTVTVTGTGPINIKRDLTITKGIFDINGLDLTLLDASPYNSTYSCSDNGTLRLQGGETIDFGGNGFDSDSGTIEFDGTGAYTGLAAGNTYYNLLFKGTGKWDLDADVDVGNNLTVSSGTFDTTANSYAIDVGSDWNYAGGTFNVNTSTVTFTNASSTSTLTGSTTFYGLVSTTSGKRIEFSSSTVTCVSGHLNLEDVILRSTLDGATWYLNLSGTQDVAGVDVQDSNASGGSTIIAYDSTNSGNNTNWSFIDGTAPAAITDLSGQCDSDTGNVTLYWSTPGDDGWNNTLPDGSKYRIDYSSYSIAWSTNTYDVDIPTHSVTPYTQVSHTITGLTGETTWYFQIWTADEVPNWSGLSNGATVWVNPILSVSISTDTIDLGVLEPGSYALTASSVVITNNGNIRQKFKLLIVSEPNASWESVTATSPGAEQYRYSGIFRSTQPVTSDFLPEDAFSVSTERTSSSADLARDADPDEQKGFNVSPYNTRNLWFKFEAPTSTDITTTQAIPVRIIAIPYP